MEEGIKNRKLQRHFGGIKRLMTRAIPGALNELASNCAQIKNYLKKQEKAA